MAEKITSMPLQPLRAQFQDGLLGVHVGNDTSPFVTGSRQKCIYLTVEMIERAATTPYRVRSAYKGLVPISD